MASVNKEDFDKLHDKVDNISETVARIEGKLEQKKTDWSILGILSAIALGVWNMLK